MAIANYTKKINGMRSIPQSHTIRSSKNYLKTTPERYMTPPDIFDLVLILRALMHHLSGIFGLWIGWGMTKNHLRIVSRERSLKCMLCSKCNGRLLLTFSGQKGSRICRPYGIARGDDGIHPMDGIHHPRKIEWAGKWNMGKSNKEGVISQSICVRFVQ